jgi:hypothetical protein
MTQEAHRPAARRSGPAAWVVLLLLLGLLASVLLQHDRWRIHWQWLVESRPAVRFDFIGLQQGWSEAELPGRLPGVAVRCYAAGPPTPADRVCAAQASRFHDIPTLYIAFFYQRGALEQVSVNVPRWAHGRAQGWLERRYGQAHAWQPPSYPNALLGWRLPDGGAVFTNRSPSLNPLEWGAIGWFSPAQCERLRCPERAPRG